MKANTFSLIMLLILTGCVNEPEKPLFDDSFYRRYTGFHTSGVYKNISGSFNLCVDPNSFIELRKDGTVSIKLKCYDNILNKTIAVEANGTSKVALEII